MKTAMTKTAASKAPKAPAMLMSMDADSKRYRAEDDLRTLTRAEEIKGDRERLREVEKCRDQQMRNLEKITVEVAPRTMRKK